MSIVANPTDVDDTHIVKKVRPELWRLPCDHGETEVVTISSAELAVHVRNLFRGDETLRVSHGKPPCQVKKEMIESGGGENDDMLGFVFHTVRGCIHLTAGDNESTSPRHEADAQGAKVPSFESVLLSLEFPGDSKTNKGLSGGVDVDT
eukprot:3111969-Pleurochrysis_carterae.AAC.1